MRHIVERDRFADDLAPAAELFLPKIVAKNDSCLRAGSRVLARERPADERFFAEHLEIVLSNEVAGQRGRFFDAGEVIVVVTARGDRFERGHLFLQVAEPGGREAEALEVLLQIARLHHHEPVGVGIGQRREQDRVDDCEDGGVRPNAERECEHRHECEPRRFAKLAKGVAQGVHGNFRGTAILAVGTTGILPVETSATGKMPVLRAD